MSLGITGTALKTNQVEAATVTAAVIVAAPTVEPFKRTTAAGVLLKAHLSNTVAIFIGPSGTTVANGYPLDPGETISIPIDEISKVYAISASASQKICYLYLGPA